MGTNYYWISDPCPICSHSVERMHIGKSSWGWCFALHVMPEHGLDSLCDWIEKWRNGGKIVDEYDEIIHYEKMEQIISKRTHPRSKKADYLLMGYRDEADFHAKNHSERGPSGLLRHVISVDGRHCIGHSEGTWDYIVGEFS